MVRDKSGRPVCYLCSRYSRHDEGLEVVDAIHSLELGAMMVGVEAGECFEMPMLAY